MLNDIRIGDRIKDNDHRANGRMMKIVGIQKTIKKKWSKSLGAYMDIPCTRITVENVETERKTILDADRVWKVEGLKTGYTLVRDEFRSVPEPALHGGE